MWVAQALWVMHSAGAAAALVAAMIDGADLPGELAVDRFDGDGWDALQTRARRLYRDIYANDTI